MNICYSLTGMRRIDSIYKKIITWNPSIAIIGYDKKIVDSIQKFGKQYEDGNVSWGWEDIELPKPVGTFQIIRKGYEYESKKIIIDCVWVTGKYAGETFSLTRNYIEYFVNNMRKDELSFFPSYIYLPSQWIVLIFELSMLSGGLFSTFSLVRLMWNILINWAISFCDYLFRISRFYFSILN